MKIVIFEAEEWEVDAFQALSEEHDLELTEASLEPENAPDYEEADVVSAFVTSTLSEDVLRPLQNLQLISTRSTGFDHIDLDYCRERGITVCNVPEYGSTTVAEHVFALLLAVSHRLVEATDRTRKGDFSSKGLQGFDLVDKTMGVVGTGAIGMHVIRIAGGFGMNVLAYDVAPDREKENELGFRYVDLDELLRQSDVVSLHVPSTAKTHHLISDDEFDCMKEEAVLINTARGEVVNVQALVRALAEGNIAGAGLDVLPEEPVIREEAELLRSVYEERHDLRTLLADNILPRMPGVVVTPHSAFNTREAVMRIVNTTVENIQAFARGTPQNVVSPDS